jgi:hypothetical protein
MLQLALGDVSRPATAPAEPDTLAITNGEDVGADSIRSLGADLANTAPSKKLPTGASLTKIGMSYV